MAFAQPQSGTDGFTYGDYLNWPAEERWELIDGVAYDMSPAPSRRHQDIVVELAAQAVAHLRGSDCRTYVAPFDVRLPRADEAEARIDTVVQPDVAVICDPAKLDDQGCRGAPDWIVEVLSPATARKDQREKRDLYERHGVHEYWLVHPVDQVLSIYRLGPAGYGKPEVLALEGTTPVAAIAGLCIHWSTLPPAAPAGG
ncbi:MAG: Uma2 family endonuclease [Chromatiaceae bacterium]|nr:MAG: Uma2 family endonuclease [Chromatiaceae bacterium]